MKKALDRWWLAGGEEECAGCQATYAYEVEVRCVHCDEAMCPVCAVWVRRKSYCVGCAPSKGTKR